MKQLIIALILSSFPIGVNAPIFTQAKAEKFFQTYRDNLTILKNEHSVISILPDIAYLAWMRSDNYEICVYSLIFK